MAIATGTALLAAGAMSAGTSLIGMNQSKKAAQGMKAEKIDINQLDAQTRDIARRNAIESMQLEQQLTPEVAALRRQSIESLLPLTQEDPYTAMLRKSLMDEFSGDQLSNAVKAAAIQDVNNLGQLPPEIRNEIFRMGAARTGASTGNLGLGRDIFARDLGLSSFNLRNQQLANAAQVSANDLNRRFGIATNVTNLRTADDNRRLAIAGLGQSINRPVVGLDPGAVANIAVANTGAQNAVNQQQAAMKAQASTNMWNGIGNAAGLAFMGASMLGGGGGGNVGWGAANGGGVGWGPNTGGFGL
jgi:hypothetical protein